MKRRRNIWILVWLVCALITLVLVALAPGFVWSQELPQQASVMRSGFRTQGPRIATSTSGGQSGRAFSDASTFTFGLVGFPRSPDSGAYGINSKGEIVGGYGPGMSTVYVDAQGFLLKGNTYHKISYPGALYTSPYGINEKGEVVGVYYGSDGVDHAFLRVGSTFTNIDYPGSVGSYATNINDSGEILGEYWDGTVGHGFTLIGGVYASFDPPGSLSTEAYGINSAGVIVGDYFDSSNVAHGFIFSSGTYTIVDYPGYANTYLSGINDKGQMIGGYGNNTILNGFEWAWTNVFFLDKGTFTTFSPPVGDVQVTWAYTLKGKKFVGFYVDSLSNINGYVAKVSP